MSIPKAGRLGRTDFRLRQQPDEIRGTVNGRETIGWLVLLVAAVLVGFAIELDRDVGRALNGLGGVLWLIGAGVLLIEARRSKLDGRRWVVVGAMVLALSWLLSPRDLGSATIGFFVGGWVLALLIRSRGSRLSVIGLLPALWLPAHLAIAAAPALYRAVSDQPAAIRTDPPPTAALVPLAMVAMAFAGGLVGGYLADRRAAVRNLSD